MNIILPILPALFLLIMGIVLKKKLLNNEQFWVGMEKLVYFVFFPVLLMETTVNSSLTLEYLYLALLAALVMFCGVLLSWITIKFSNAPIKTRTSIFQCGFRFNTYVGIAIIAAAFGDEGVAYFAIVAGVCVPIANLAAVSALSINSGQSVLLEVSKNPLVIGTLSGIILNLLGVKFPELVQSTFKLISNSAVVLGLMTVGAALQFSSFGFYRKLSVSFLLLKLLILPMLTILILQFVEISQIMKSILIIFATLPTASSAYILAMRMNGDGKTVALQISLGSVLSMGSIPVILYLSSFF